MGEKSREMGEQVAVLYREVIASLIDKVGIKL